MTIARRIPPLTVEGGLLAARTALATEMAWGDGSRVGGFFGGVHKNEYLGTVLGDVLGTFFLQRNCCNGLFFQLICSRQIELSCCDLSVSDDLHCSRDWHMTFVHQGRDKRLPY